MEKKINFSLECSVFIVAKAGDSEETIKLRYERPQCIDDDVLTKEALNNFKDMKRKNLNNVKDLVGIVIARSQKQYDEISK